MPICLPCRSGNHPMCLAHGCVCQHRTTPLTPEPSGSDGNRTITRESTA